MKYGTKPARNDALIMTGDNAEATKIQIRAVEKIFKKHLTILQHIYFVKILNENLIAKSCFQKKKIRSVSLPPRLSDAILLPLTTNFERTLNFDDFSKLFARPINDILPNFQLQAHQTLTVLKAGCGKSLCKVWGWLKGHPKFIGWTSLWLSLFQGRTTNLGVHKGMVTVAWVHTRGWTPTC